MRPTDETIHETMTAVVDRVLSLEKMFESDSFLEASMLAEELSNDLLRFKRYMLQKSGL